MNAPPQPTLYQFIQAFVLALPQYVTVLIVAIIRVSPWEVSILTVNNGVVQALRLFMGASLLKDHLEGDGGSNNCEIFPAFLTSIGYSRHLPGAAQRFPAGRSCDQAKGIQQFMQLIDHPAVKERGLRIIGLVQNTVRLANDPSHIDVIKAKAAELNPKAEFMSMGDMLLDISKRQGYRFDAYNRRHDYFVQNASQKSVTHGLEMAFAEELDNQEEADALANQLEKEESLPEEIITEIVLGVEHASNLQVGATVLNGALVKLESLAKGNADPDCFLEFVNGLELASLTDKQLDVLALSYSRCSEERERSCVAYIDIDSEVEGTTPFISKHQSLANIAAVVTKHAGATTDDLKMAFFHDDGRKRNKGFNPQLTLALIYCILCKKQGSALKDFVVSILTRINAESYVLNYVRGILHKIDMNLVTSKTLAYAIDDLEEAENRRNLYVELLNSGLVEDLEDEVQEKLTTPEERQFHYAMASLSKSCVWNTLLYKKFLVDYSEQLEAIKAGNRSYMVLAKRARDDDDDDDDDGGHGKKGAKTKGSSDDEGEEDNA